MPCGTSRATAGRLATLHAPLAMMTDFVVQLPREPGSREARYAHLMCGPVDMANLPQPIMLVLDDYHRVDTGPLREVMAFPKTQTAACPLTQAPSVVETGQLLELGIHVRKPPEIE